MINFASPSLDPEDFLSFARLAVLTVAGCSSMIVSMVSRGDIKGGLKYLPIFVIISLITFAVVNKIFTAVFAAKFI